VGRDLQQQQHEDAVSSLLVEQQQQQQQEASAVSANAASGAAADVEPAVQLSVCAGGSDEAGSSHSGWTGGWSGVEWSEQQHHGLMTLPVLRLCVCMLEGEQGSACMQHT